jgi:methyl-accepting chemotaxis protein
MKPFLTIAIALMLGTAGVSLAQSSVAIPTAEEIKADLTAGKYQDVIKKSARALSVKGDAAVQTDRAAIEALKADAYLHLKQNGPASEAYTAAAKDCTDPKEAGLYRATALLVRRSRGQNYIPKTSTADSKEKPAPIDILAEDSRRKAFAALFADESRATSSKVESIKNKQSLKPIMDVLHDVLDLRAVELAGTDSDEQSKKMVGEVADHAGKLMDEAIKNLSATVEKINTTANQSTQHRKNSAYGSGEMVISKRGLSSTDKNTLEDVIATTKDIESAVDQMSASMGDQAGQITDVKQHASTLANRANEVLKADYTDQSTRPNNTPIRTSPTPGANNNDPNNGANQQPPPPHR